MRPHGFTALALVLLAGAALSTQPDEPEVVQVKPLPPPTMASLRKSLEEPIDSPEEFKQPVPLRIVLKHYADLLSGKGQAFPIWINQAAFRRETNKEHPIE